MNDFIRHFVRQLRAMADLSKGLEGGAEILTLNGNTLKGNSYLTFME